MKLFLKNIIAVTLTLTMVISLFAIVPSFAFAGETETSGKCGDNAFWDYNATTKTLTISGTGAMYDYKKVYDGKKYKYSANGSPLGYIEIYGGTAPWHSGAEDTVGKEKPIKFDIETVKINSGITTVGAHAFFRFEKTTNFILSEGLTEIKTGAFEECSALQDITIPKTVWTFGEAAFYSCVNLRKVTLQEGLVEIGTGVFYNCQSLSSISIPTTVKTVGGYAFEYCVALSAVYITDLSAWCDIDFLENASSNPLYYGEKLYLNNVLITDLVIPKGIKTIKNSAFVYGTAITSATIPEGVESIGIFTFAGCENLKKVTLPKSLTNISYGAFTESNNINEVHYYGTEELWNRINIGSSNEGLLNAKIIFEKSEPDFVYGDLDGDGITATDALLTLQASIGILSLTTEQRKIVDVDGDGGVSANDALLILQLSINLIDNLPVSKK